MEFVPVRVDAYAGYRGEETPRAFEHDGATFVIEEILDRWYQGGVDPAAPVADYFKVRIAGGAVRILRYERGQWCLGLGVCP